MSIEYKEIPEHNAVEFTLEGTVTKDDYHELFKKFEAFLENRDSIKILEIIEDAECLKGLDLKVFWEGLKFDAQHWKKYEKCAVVSDMTWVSPMVQLADKLTAIQARRYEMSELFDAREWLYAPEVDA